jgi:hypothetical protein
LARLPRWGWAATSPGSLAVWGIGAAAPSRHGGRVQHWATRSFDRGGGIAGSGEQAPNFRIDLRSWLSLFLLKGLGEHYRLFRRRKIKRYLGNLG